MAGEMIVCSCNVLSDMDIKSCLLEGGILPSTPAAIHERLGSTPQCGCCTKAIRAIVRTETCAAAKAEAAVTTQHAMLP